MNPPAPESRESCKARRVINRDAVEEKGDFVFIEVEGGLSLFTILPSGICICIPVVKGPPTGTGRGPWGWDGNEDAPTITPSIWTKGHWHGYLTAGEFRSC